MVDVVAYSNGQTFYVWNDIDEMFMKFVPRVGAFGKFPDSDTEFLIPDGSNTWDNGFMHSPVITEQEYLNKIVPKT